MATAIEQIRAGFIPLTDSAPLIVAQHRGFAAEEGLDLILSRETSWANIRDRLAVSQLDIAHALAPLPIASNLGLGPFPTRLVAPMTLGFGGNTITVSRSVWRELQARGATPDFDPYRSALALSNLVGDRAAKGNGPLIFGIVHPHSAHRFELAYWLAAVGLRLERDVEMVVLPPPFMADAIATGQIDGFCAGEPWGSLAVRDEGAAILTTKSHIWRASPEKVLAVRESWVTQDSDRLARLIRAVWRACVWCDDPANHAELADLLASEKFLDLSSDVLRLGLSRGLITPAGAPRKVPTFLAFARNAATFPWSSHALWLFAQMVRWGDVPFTEGNAQTARATYRPDLYRAALSELDVAIPSANAKVEGALSRETPVGTANGRLSLGPDGFFDGRVFDPDRLQDYLTELGSSDG